MADTITNTVLYNGKRRAVVRSEIASDGVGSTDAVLVDRSTFTGPDGTEPGRIVIEKIEHNCDGMQVVLEFEHTTDDLIVTLSGQNVLDFGQDGKYQGFIDPNSAGGTGDIVGTTVGHTAGDKAVIVFYLRFKD